MSIIIDIDRALDALNACDPACTRSEWVALAMSAKAAGIGFDDFDQWSAGAANYSARDCRSTWNSINGSGGIGPGTLFRAARDAGWRPSRDGQVRERDNRYHPRKAVSGPVAPLKRETLSEYGAELFAVAVAPRRTVGEQYVVARNGVLPPADGDLRFHAQLKHPASDYAGPALVALVTDAATGAPLTLHRTWINADGTKADCDPPRMLLGGHRKAGGVIRLWPDEAVTTGLAIAEGIETALSLAHAFTPVWACIDAGNLAAFPVLPGIECLTIAADHDDAGIKAANTCAQRWTDAGREVRIVMAPTPGMDINDMVARAA